MVLLIKLGIEACEGLDHAWICQLKVEIKDELACIVGFGFVMFSISSEYNGVYGDFGWV